MYGMGENPLNGNGVVATLHQSVIKKQSKHLWKHRDVIG